MAKILLESVPGFTYLFISFQCRRVTILPCAVRPQYAAASQLLQLKKSFIGSEKTHREKKHIKNIFMGLSWDFLGDFVYVFCSPIRNDLKKKNTLTLFWNPPSPGTIPQICSYFCVLSFPDLWDTYLWSEVCCMSRTSYRNSTGIVVCLESRVAKFLVGFLKKMLQRPSGVWGFCWKALCLKLESHAFLEVVCKSHCL